MGYIPVQRDAGRIMYESAMQRAGTIGGAVSGLFQALNQQQQAAQAAAEAKAEENRQFNAKLKALESLVQTHKDKFNLSDEQLKQFLSRDPNDSAKTHYLKLGEFVERSMKASELEKTQAETQLKRLEAIKAIQAAQPAPRTYMSIDELTRRYPRDQFDYSGIRDVAGQPGVVDVTEMKISGRAPAPPVAPVSVGASGGTLVDPNTGQTRIIPGIPQAGPGEMIVYPKTAPSAAPAGLPKFLPSGSMLPSTASSGQAGARVPEEAIKAVSVVSGEPTVPRIVAIPGGEAERKAQTAATARETQTERRLSSAQNILNAIDRIERNKDKTSAIGIAPVGMYSGLRKATSNAAVNVAEGIKTIEANIGFDELRGLKESGTSLGQVAIKELENLQKLRGSISQDLSPDEFNRSLSQFKNDAKISIERIKLLQDAYQSGKSVLDGEAKKRFDELGRGFSQDFKATQSIPTAGAVKRLNVQRGESAGSSTLAPAAPDLSAFEGRVLVNPQGKRVRIVNGKEVPLQ